MIRIFLLVILFVNTVFGSAFEEAQTALKNKQYEKAIELFRQSAKYGNNEANFKLGIIYYKGNGIKKDLSLAMKYFQRASAAGHLKAKYNTGVIYATKNYEKHDYKEAYKIFEELSIVNYPSAQNKLGLFLLHGLGVDKDYKKAVKWFEEAYFINHYLPASCNLALMYASGKGVFPNFGRARELAQEGYDKNLPMCVKVYKDFNLHKYHEDKGFKYGFYK